MKFPKASKIEKVVSKDPAQPILNHPFLRIEPDGSGMILASDKFTALAIPVEVTETDTSGPANIEAVKAARKNNTDLRCEPGYCIADGNVAYPRDDAKYPEFPPVDRLLVEAEACVYEVALNAKTLFNLAEAMGTEVIKLRLQADVNNLPIGVEPHPAEPHIRGARAALMPYRVKDSV